MRLPQTPLLLHPQALRDSLLHSPRVWHLCPCLGEEGDTLFPAQLLSSTRGSIEKRLAVIPFSSSSQASHLGLGTLASRSLSTPRSLQMLS